MMSDVPLRLGVQLLLAAVKFHARARLKPFGVVHFFQNDNF